MREKKDDKETAAPLPVYESQPPVWLPYIHGEADLGYPGFYPPRPGQDEDVLSETNIKNGFILGQPVSVETFSAQTMINEKLNSRDTLSKLEELMNEVFIRRSERIPPIPPSSFRMPTRVTLNDAKRQAWFADLANPDVPLHKLGKSVPHGAKGHDLLDLLHSNNVAISRAVWVLRVFGANETAGLRNKPSYNPTQYSVEWANLVTSYIKKQLQEIALPSAPRPGLNIKQTFKGVLADSDSRDRWISRFTYCLKLLRTFYAEGLVDNRTFLVWLVQQMSSCNLAQAGFVTRLTDEYLDDILKIRALAHPLVEACLAKLCEISTTSAQDFLVDTEQLLKLLLQRSCLAIPDAFISPRLWSTYSSLLENVMEQNLLDTSNNSCDRYLEQSVRELRQALLSNLADIRKRNQALSFRERPSQMSAKLSTAVSDVKLLNSISSDTDMKLVRFFSDDQQDSARFAEKLDMLLTWSVTPLQYGDHRALAAVTLIRNWRDKACERATRRGCHNPNDFLQDQLFDWLDSSSIAGESTNIPAVALLYGKLVKHELFSYTKYIQRLIARGEPGLAYSEEVASRHRHFLSWIPLFNSTPSLINQRKVTLYGVRTRDTPEELTERQIRKEIRALLPELFGGPPHDPWMSTAALLADCKTLLTASRFEQVRTFRQWLLPTFQKYIASTMTDLSQPSILKSYHISVELMDYSKCFHSILDLTLCLLLHATDMDTMNGVVDTLRRYAAIWSCMDIMPTIVSSLNSAHQLWKSQGIQSRPLLSLLMEFDNGRYLSEASRNRSMVDIATFANALQPMVEHPELVPDVLPEIHHLAGDSDINAPSMLANSLWIKYRMSSDWALKVWSNTITSIRQIADDSPDADTQTCAFRYGTLLWRVDQHLASGLDGYILYWLLNDGKGEVPLLSRESWNILEIILLHLVVHGALRTTTILSGLIYPAWELAASQDAIDPVLVTYLSAANTICHRLLLQEEGRGKSLMPQDLFDIQLLRTRRQAVYFEPHFPSLAANIPTLISLENNENLPKDLREESSSLRRQLCQDPGFRQGVYRNLDVIREAFENSPYLMDTSCESLRNYAIAGLRMILWDSVDDTDAYDWLEVSCLLSPWKLAATTIQMQFHIKQLGRALTQDVTHDLASANLDKLTTMLFHHTKTSEEAYYVGEMARGAEDAVAAKFVKNGLKCIGDLLSDDSDNIDSLACLARVGELLRVLIHVTMPFRDLSAALPSLDTSVHEHFYQVLHAKITNLGSLIANDETHSLQHKCDLILLARLLQFVLNFRSISWTSTMKDAARKLGNAFFGFALHYGSGNHIDPTLFPLLIDTLLCIYDELPHDAKSISYDPFQHYPDVQPSTLPPDLPSEYRKQLLTIISRNPLTPIVSNLVNSHRDSNGNLVLGSSVVNRPWDWVENLGEPVTDSKEDKDREERERLKAKNMIRNSGSLSLDIFGARLTGDSIISNLAVSADRRIEGDLRSFEDGLSSENLFTRDWRETRLSVDVQPSHEHVQQTTFESNQAIAGSIYTAALKSEVRPTPKGSPASSVVSRSSARGSNSSKRHQSPSQGSSYHRTSNSTMSDIIDADSLSTVASRKETAAKRKAAVSDDEVEFVEGPVAPRAMAAVKRARTTKAPAGKTTAKTRGKKK